MHIPVQGNIYSSVSKNFTQALDIKAEFNTACGKCMSQCMEIHRNQATLFLYIMEITIWFDNGKNVSSPIFKNLFYGHMVLRPSCYECPYKSIMHPGDITIADYWGIEKAAPEFDDNKGVSLVLVNNEKADSIFENVKIELKWKSTRIEDSMQPPLKAPFPKPEGREQFWNDVNDKSFSYIARAYGDNGTANYIKKVLRRAKRKIQHLISKT